VNNKVVKELKMEKSSTVCS